jgi:hypothetical protein
LDVAGNTQSDLLQQLVLTDSSLLEDFGHASVQAGPVLGREFSGGQHKDGDLAPIAALA